MHQKAPRLLPAILLALAAMSGQARADLELDVVNRAKVRAEATSGEETLALRCRIPAGAEIDAKIRVRDPGGFERLCGPAGLVRR